MPQHLAYIYTIADMEQSRSAIMKWWRDGVEFPHHQEQSPWLLYYNQWFDPWLSSWEYGHRLKSIGLKIHSPVEDVWYMAPSESNKTALKNRLRKKYQYEETKWIDSRLMEAMRAYEKCRIRRRVYLFNKCTASVLCDEELIGKIRIQQNAESGAADAAPLA